MSATAAPLASDRSDFRTVTVGGATLGVATAVAVVAFLAASRLVPIAAGTRGGVQALIVLAGGGGREGRDDARASRSTGGCRDHHRGGDRTARRRPGRFLGDHRWRLHPGTRGARPRRPGP